MSNKLLITVAIFIVFTYGVVIGKYQVFPYEALVEVKRIFKPIEDIGFRETPKYQHKVSFYQHNALQQYDWVFVGDSITDGSHWHELFPDVTVANRGIGGDITLGVLNRMDTIVNTKAKLALLMIGVNDTTWGFSVEEIAKNHANIVEQLQNAGMDVVIHAVIFTDGIMANNEKINRLNVLLKQFSEQKQLLYVDLNPLLAPNGLLEKRFTFDGIHLDGKAYKIWAEQLKKQLKLD